MHPTGCVAVPDNLEHLFLYDKDALEAISGVQASGRITTFDGPMGPVVQIEGRKLHSGRDPEREARRWARDLDISEVTVVVVLGCASAYHVRAIEARCDATVVVFEPDLEVLACGLKHGDLGDRSYVFNSPERMARFLTGILTGTDRGVLAMWTPSMRFNPGAYAKALRHATDAVGRAKLRHRTACLRGRGWLQSYLGNLPQLDRALALPGLHGKMRGTPAIIVAAGPSLDHNVAQLQQLREHCLVLSVNTAAKALARADVRPHALVSIESADVSAGLEDLSWLTQLPAFLELTGHRALWDLPFAKRVAISVDTNACSVFSNRLDPGMGIAAGFCVANAAVAIAAAMGCAPIVLVGSDLAHSHGRVYANGTLFEDIRAETDDEGTITFTGMDQRRRIEAKSVAALGGNRSPATAQSVQVPAWNGRDEVRTTRDFMMFRDWYTHFAGQNPDLELINATQGGAFIEGWQHLTLEQVGERIRVDTTPVVSAGTRFETALGQTRGAAPHWRRDVALELASAQELLETIERALSVVNSDPDGDLRIDEAAVDTLHELNARARELLRTAPLVGEAAFPAVEELRIRGDITTYSFYASLREPVQELAAELARLLQKSPGESTSGPGPSVMGTTAKHG